MSGEQWGLLAGFLGVVGTQISLLGGWAAALSPLFVGTVLVQLGLFLRAFYTPKPNSLNQ